MEFIGIGCDVIQIPRIAKLCSDRKFIERIFSQNEIIFMEKFNMKEEIKIGYIAKRYAAKEAFSKAIGVGIGKISFREIEILKNIITGQPYFTEKTLKLTEKNLGRNHLNAMLSLSDDYPVALAYVLITEESS